MRQFTKRNLYKCLLVWLHFLMSLLSTVNTLIRRIINLRRILKWASFINSNFFNISAIFPALYFWLSYSIIVFSWKRHSSVLYTHLYKFQKVIIFFFSLLSVTSNFEWLRIQFLISKWIFIQLLKRLWWTFFEKTILTVIYIYKKIHHSFSTNS